MPFALPAAAAAISTAGVAAGTAAATTAAATAATTVSLTTIATNALINLAVSAVMSALSPQVGQAGRPIDWILDPDAPIPFAAGRVGAAGTIVHKNTFGPDLMYYGFVSVLSGSGPIKGLVGFQGDEETVTFDGNGKAVTSQWEGEMWLKSQRGTQPTTQAMTSPIGLKNSATLPGWNSSYKLNAKAAYMLIMGENSKRTAYPNGEVKPVVTFEGLYGWDPRLDSTYPGGSGPCRLNDSSTWVYLTNPILWGLKWALGLWEGPNGKGAPQVDFQVGGMGAKVEGIDVPAFVNGANVADANGWIVAAYPNTDDDKAQVLDSFLQAGGCVYAQIAGKISCIQRAAPRTSLVTISAADTAGPLEIDTAASRINRINTIRPRFWSEANRWQMTAIDEVTATSYQVEDGNNKRTRGVDFPFVPVAKQAAELAALQIANTREGIAGVIPLKPHMQRVAPGDAFTITEAGFVLDGLKCLCLNSEYDTATDIYRVTFVSETDAKYPFALGQNPNPPAPPVLTPVDPTFVRPPDPGDWDVTVREVSEGGSQVVVFDVVGEVQNLTATGLIIEISTNTNSGFIQVWSGPPTATSIPITGMQPGDDYFVFISYQRGQNVSNRLTKGPFRAPEVVALSPDESEALDRLLKIESDNWLTYGEKPEVIQQFDTISGEYEGIREALQDAGLTAAYDDYTAKTNALVTYLNGLSPAWNDLTKDTPLIGSELRTAFKNYYVSKQAANTALAGSGAAGAEEALLRLAIIESDGVLSRGEKSQVILDVSVLNSERAGLVARGVAAGASTTAYTDALDALNAYLATLTPAWNNTATDTPVVAGTFRSNFGTAYLARQSLLNAILGINTTDSQDALAALDIIASDNWLSRGEKPEIIRQHGILNNDYPGLEAQAVSLGVSAPLIAHANAIVAMNNYLYGLVPNWDDLTQNTPIVGATLRTRISACYTTKQTLLNAFVNAVDADAQAVIDELSRISSDNWLTKGEKPEVVRTWQGILSESGALHDRAVALGVSVAAFDTAYNALAGYLGGLSPAYNDYTADTAIVGTTFRAKFSDYYVARTVLQNAMLGALDASSRQALDELTRIASDNWLTKGEKPAVVQAYAALSGEYTDLVNRAVALGVTTTLTNYQNATTALNAYLGGLSPAWNDLANDTAIVGATFRTRWADYYAAKTALQNAMTAAANATGQAAVDAIARISSDNWLTVGEKPEIIRQWDTINSEAVNIRARGVAVGLSVTAFENAFNGLAGYLGALSPAYNDLTADTIIVGATFRSYFITYYNERTNLLNAITGVANTNAQNAIDAITRIGSDNWLTMGEKPEVIRQYSIMNNDYPNLAAQASALGVSAALSNHGAAINAFNNYVQSLSPAWNNLTVDTPISGTTLVALFTNVATTRQLLLNAFTATLDAEARAALDRVAAIDADNVLSRGEKAEIIRQWTAVSTEYATIAGKLNDLGLGTALSEYNTATTNLSNYLSGLSPAWNNTSVDTPINSSTLTSVFTNYSFAKQKANIAIGTYNSGPTMRVSFNTRGISRNVNTTGNFTTTTNVILTVTGGSGSYSYEWFLMPANSNGGNAASAAITGTNGPSSYFSATVAAGEVVFGSFGCDVIDTVTGQKVTSLHTGRIVNTA